MRTEPYSDDELKAHDRRLPKYFLAGGAFLLLGGVHMVLKNLPWTAEWLARAGYAGHLVRDLSNTHVMIVGGGTLISTGLCWYVLPRIVGRPLTSPGLAQGAFWFTAVGLLVFYIALIANGIAMGRLVSSGWDYEAAKLHMGKAYRVPVGIGAGVMGLGYWCFAANVFLTIFQSRLVRVPKPSGHLWKFLATGAAGLTVGTVQGVIQVQPAHADWLYKAGHAGEWIDPISHAHINLVTGLTMLTAGALFALAPALGGKAPTRRVANLCFWSLLGGSLAFYGVALYLGFHEGRLVVRHGLRHGSSTGSVRIASTGSFGRLSERRASMHSHEPDRRARHGLRRAPVATRRRGGADAAQFRLGAVLRSSYCCPGRAAALLDHLRGGADLALVTDAGTPAVSDPAGPRRGVGCRGRLVVPIPGAWAVLAAVAASGVAGPRWRSRGSCRGRDANGASGSPGSRPTSGGR